MSRRTGADLSVHDVAVELSRINRWKGDTVVPWTVLQHILAGLVYIEDTILRIHWAFHEVDEVLTGDIAHGHKTEIQSAYGEQIRRDFYSRVLKLPYPDEDKLLQVRALDWDVAIAEATCFLHPNRRGRVLEAAPEGFTEPNEELVDIVWRLRDLTPREAATQFETAAEVLLNSSQAKVLERRG